MLRTTLAALALAFGLAGVADAAQFHLTYTTSVDSTSGPAITFDGILTTDDGSFYGGSGYRITDIAGTRGLEAVTFDSSTFNDEIFYPGDSDGNYVDGFGLSFLAGGVSYNLYRNGAGDFAYHEFDGATGRLVFEDSISLEAVAAAVPEPETWAIMIVGLALAAGALRRRRAVA